MVVDAKRKMCVCKCVTCPRNMLSAPFFRLPRSFQRGLWLVVAQSSLPHGFSPDVLLFVRKVVGTR